VKKARVKAASRRRRFATGLVATGGVVGVTC